jgi:hypothetical protein
MADDRQRPRCIAVLRYSSRAYKGCHVLLSIDSPVFGLIESAIGPWCPKQGTLSSCPAGGRPRTSGLKSRRRALAPRTKRSRARGSVPPMVRQHHFLGAAVHTGFATNLKAGLFHVKHRQKQIFPPSSERMGPCHAGNPSLQPIRKARWSSAPWVVPRATAKRTEPSAITQNDHAVRGSTQSPPHLRRFLLRGA